MKVVSFYKFPGSTLVCPHERIQFKVQVTIPPLATERPCRFVAAAVSLSCKMVLFFLTRNAAPVYGA